MSHDASLVLALVFAAIVAALHALGPRLRAVPGLEAASGTSLSLAGRLGSAMRRMLAGGRAVAGSNLSPR